MGFFAKLIDVFYIDENLAHTTPMRIFIVRLLEFMVASAALSALVVILNVLGIFVQPLHVFIVTSVAVVAFMLIQFRLQRKYYLSVEGKFKMFFPTIIAYIVFMTLSVITYFVNYNVFVCLFGMMKFACYYVWFPLKDWASLGAFHILGVLVVTLSHLSMKGYVRAVNEDDQEDEGPEESEEPKEPADDKIVF